MHFYLHPVFKNQFIAKTLIFYIKLEYPKERIEVVKNQHDFYQKV